MLFLLCLWFTICHGDQIGCASGKEYMQVFCVYLSCLSSSTIAIALFGLFGVGLITWSLPRLVPGAKDSIYGTIVIFSECWEMQKIQNFVMHYHRHDSENGSTSGRPQLKLLVVVTKENSGPRFTAFAAAYRHYWSHIPFEKSST